MLGTKPYNKLEMNLSYKAYFYNQALAFAQNYFWARDLKMMKKFGTKGLIQRYHKLIAPLYCAFKQLVDKSIDC